MKKFDEKILEQIKQQVSILDIAKEMGFSLIPKSSGNYSLEEHDSVIIYPKTNSFCRYSRNDGNKRMGGDVLKFMGAFKDDETLHPELNHENYTFTQAYELLSKRIDKTLSPDKKIQSLKKQSISFKTNPLAENQKRARNIVKQFHFDTDCKSAMAYLVQTRKLDPEIVNKLRHENCIKQETTHLYKNKYTRKIIVNKRPHNIKDYEDIETKAVVFIGHDEYGLIASACKRSCMSNSNFKGDISGTDYNYGWLNDPEVLSCNAYLPTQKYNPGKRLVCFESYIDMISFQTLLKQQGTDYTKYAYLSCGSVTKISSILATQERIGYKKVTIAFDNDVAGREASATVKSLLEKKGVSVNERRSITKDWNNDLLIINYKRERESKGLTECKEEASKKLAKKRSDQKVVVGDTHKNEIDR